MAGRLISATGLRRCQLSGLPTSNLREYLQWHHRRTATGAVGRGYLRRHAIHHWRRYQRTAANEADPRWHLDGVYYDSSAGVPLCPREAPFASGQLS